MQLNAVMERLRALLRKPYSSNEIDDQEYEQLVAGDDTDAESRDDGSTLRDPPEETPFYWLEYAVFVLLGVAMLWAWLVPSSPPISSSTRQPLTRCPISRNMFLAASPYFASHFAESSWILANFQSSIISISTATNLLTMLILSNLQATASYPLRIAAALLIDIAAFALLALSTVLLPDVSAPLYLAFLLTTVFATATATGLLQNGAFAFAASFGHPSYTQAIMTGQAIAGVLPSIAQIVSVLAMPSSSPHQSPTSALLYFLTATLIALLTLLSFIPLVRRHARLLTSRLVSTPDLTASLASLSLPDPSAPTRKTLSLPALYAKLPAYSTAIALCFAVTMCYPVFAARILSVHDPATAPPYLQPAAFVPLAFLVWNTGDLLGRLSALLPACATLSHRPLALAAVALARTGFVPLYMLCNVRGVDGEGAVVASDVFYLGVVQLGFGVSNGWLAACAMMGAAEMVEEGEREAVGGFMGFNLVLGLAVGSLASFAVA